MIFNFFQKKYPSAINQKNITSESLEGKHALIKALKEDKVLLRLFLLEPEMIVKYMGLDIEKDELYRAYDYASNLFYKF